MNRIRNCVYVLSICINSRISPKLETSCKNFLPAMRWLWWIVQMNSRPGAGTRKERWTKLLNWLRIVQRRRYRLLFTSFRRWNDTTGQEWRGKSRQTSHAIAEHAREEVTELSADVRQRLEKAQPQIEKVAQDAKDRAKQAWISTRRLLRIAASVVASSALVAAIGIAIFFLSRSSDTVSAELTCDNCPRFTVSRIIDGDTIDTNVGRIRIYGADTPERGEHCFSEATDEMDRLAGNVVRGERGPRSNDPFGRNLYYLYTESGDSIDELLIKTGFAFAWTGDGQHRSLMIETESTARRNEVGCLWK